jgi:tetratricopeptide (TPR) repeat protein
VLARPEPETGFQGLVFYWHYARGCAFSGLGQTENAQRERDEMEETYKGLPSGRAFGTLPNEWAVIHEMAARALDARILADRSDLGGAIRQWRKAVAAEDQMNYHEPPDWYYPMRESLGAALLRNKQLREAEQVFRNELVQNPSNPRALFGLYKTLEAEGKTKEAERFRQLFTQVWKGDHSELRIQDF